MFAMTTQGGQALAMPDPCKTPTPGGPVPVPYPNIAMMNQAKGDTVIQEVFVCDKPALVRDTIIAQTTGDEPGTLNGVVSNKIKGEARFRSASAKVFAKGKAMVALGADTAHNGNNANAPVGKVIAPSQTKVIIGG